VPAKVDQHVDVAGAAPSIAVGSFRSTADGRGEAVREGALGIFEDAISAMPLFRKRSLLEQRSTGSSSSTPSTPLPSTL
jgi:hypothetical protein